MNGIKKIGPALCMAILLASCGKNAPGVTPEPEKERQLTLSATMEACSRAGADDAGVLTWQDGDRIGVLLDDGSFAGFSLVSGAGTGSAEFEGTVPAGRSLGEKAVYPYPEAFEGAYSYSSGSGLSVNLPGRTPYVSDAFIPAIMSADIDGDAPLSFTHEGAVMQFTVVDIPQQAVSFTFSSTGAVYGNDAYTITFPAGGAVSRVFSVPVSAGTLPSFTISLADAQGGTLVSKSKSAPTGVERRELRILTPLAVERKGSFRFLEYNILGGMKSDAGNNYDNFVAWVSEMAPDVLILCESRNTDDSLEKYETFFKAHIKSLASRWGHDYISYVFLSNFPVTITSSHPLTLVQTFKETAYTKHGALHVKVADYDLVGLHLLPTLDDGFDTETTTKWEYYGAQRLAELNYILDNTLRNPSCGDVDKWVFAGDFNMYSSLEATAHSPFGGTPAFKYPDGSVACDVYDTIAAGLTDAVYAYGGGIYKPTMYHGRSRIDYFFVSPDVYSTVQNADVVLGGFPGNYTASETANPSDHFPVLMDLAWYSFKVLDGTDTLEDFPEESLFED